MRRNQSAIGRGADTLGWAIFLGMSWTWCIGMFLPVLLVRDLGVWAWVVFAVPNVIGAAAMAWVLPNAAASERATREHAVACRWFSIVTLAFHAFFYAWLIRRMAGPVQLAGAIVFAVIAITVFIVRRGDLIAAAAVLGVSLMAAAVLLHRGMAPHLPPAVAASGDLIWLTPVCAFGLMLCPYLDLTFHQGRQATSSAGGRVAFAMGFGIFFLAMIVFTLGYSGWLIQSPASLPALVAAPLGIHLVSQTALKLVLHGRAAAVNLSAGIAMGLFVAAAAVAGMFCGATEYFYHGLSFGEIGYRAFISCYGLIFPAYVWIRMVGNRSKWNWIAAVLIALPMYWMGFIERQMIWLAPGVMIVVLAGIWPGTIMRVRQAP